MEQTTENEQIIDVESVVDQNVIIDGGTQDLNMLMNSGDSNYMVIQELEIPDGSYVTDGTNILGGTMQFLKVAQPGGEGCEENAILQFQDENTGLTYIQIGDQISQVQYIDENGMPILEGTGEQQFIITSEPQMSDDVSVQEASVSSADLFVQAASHDADDTSLTLASAQGRKYVPHSRSILKKSLQQRDDVTLKLCEKNGIFIECPKSPPSLEMITTSGVEPISDVQLLDQPVIVQDANTMHIEIEEHIQGDMMVDESLLATKLPETEAMVIGEELKENIQAIGVGETNFVSEIANSVDGLGKEMKLITSRSPEALPRFLQVDAKAIQDALKVHSQNQSDEQQQQQQQPPGVNPFFKICKMARKADGSIECAPMNMRDLTSNDRQRVYQAMLEKFPDVVKKQAANVISPQHMSKLDPKLQSSLKSHKGKGQASSTSTKTQKGGARKKRFIRSMINDVAPTASSTKSKTGLAGHYGNVTFISSTDGDESIVQTFLPETSLTSGSSSPTESGATTNGVLAEAMQIIRTSETAHSNVLPITLTAENVIQQNQQLIFNVENSVPELQSVPLNVDLLVQMAEPEKVKSVVSPGITIVNKVAKESAKTNVKLVPVSVNDAPRSDLAMKMLCKKVTILPPPPHSCKKQYPNMCVSCKTEFESKAAFEEHCLLQHVEVLPHLFAAQCQFHCILCRKEKKRLMNSGESLEENKAFATSICHNIVEAKEHFQNFHYNEQVNECEMCKLLVKVDHMYAAPQGEKSNAAQDAEVVMLSSDENQASAQNQNASKPQTVKAYELASTVRQDEQSKSSAEQITKPSDIHRILKSFDKDHRKGQGVQPKPPVKKLYKCRYCEKEFQKRSIWKMHVLAHLGHHPMLCPLCGMSFHRRASLSLHMQVHLQPQQKGDISDDPEMPKRVLKRKKQTVRRDKENVIKSKNEPTTAIEPAACQSAQQPKSPVLCEICGQKLKNRCTLIQHQHRAHNVPRKRHFQRNVTPVTCPDCGKICRGPTALKQHNRSCGVKESLCEICGKVYVGSRALSNHRYQMHKWHRMRKKGGVRKNEEAIEAAEPAPIMPAELCNTENEPDSSDERPDQLVKEEVCHLCGFVARYSTSMRSHLVNKHKYPKKRSRTYNAEPLACSKCGTMCKGPGALKLHEKRFCLQTVDLQCPTCNKVCTSRKNLSRHKYNHKWWGTEKEKAWKEKRKLLGIPIRKKKPKLDSCNNEDDQPTFQLIMNIPTDGQSDTMVQDVDGEPPKHFIDANTLMQVIQAANRAAMDNDVEPQTVQVHFPLMNGQAPEETLATMAELNPTDVAVPVEEAAEETIVADINEDAGSNKLVNLLSSYQVVLTDENGQPVVACLPDFGDKG